MDEQLERKDAVGKVVKKPIKPEELLPSPDTSERSVGTSSPPPNCSICLGKLINTSFTDSCLHQFCFTCLLQWSKIKTECPLCKQTFKSIIHNVRSEEDYDQYHVPREVASQLPSSQFPATLDVNFELVGGVADVGLQRFVYRTTMTPNRRYGVLLNPEQVSRRVQIPSMMQPSLSREERTYRRVNPTGYRRNVYRLGERSNLLPDVYGRFRECSAEYYRRHPNELNRLIPWINRELQTLLNANEPHIAYVLRVVMDALARYDIRSTEFRDMVRPYFGQFIDHFAHELLNYARTNFDLIGYDQYVTYPARGLAASTEYVTRVISSNSSASSASSDDSDIRVLDETIHVSRISAVLPSMGPHIIDMSGPSTVGETFQISQMTSHGPDVLTVSSSSSSSEECAVVGYVKPRHERTPEIIEVLSSGEVSEPSKSYEASSRTPMLHDNDCERPGPSHEDRRRSTPECCSQKTAQRPSRRRWSTTSSSATNDGGNEYSLHSRKQWLYDNPLRPRTRDHTRNIRSYALTNRLGTARSPNNMRQRQASTSVNSIHGIGHRNKRRKFRDRTHILTESFIISDSESSSSNRKSSGSSHKLLTVKARKGIPKDSSRLGKKSSSSIESESDKSEESYDRKRRQARTGQKMSSHNRTPCSAEISPNTVPDKSTQQQPVQATLLRKSKTKSDEWYVKKNVTLERRRSWSSSSQSDVKIRNPPRRLTISEYKGRLDGATNPGFSGNGKILESTRTKPEHGQRFMNRESTENFSCTDVTNGSNSRYSEVSGRMWVKERSKRKHGRRKQKIHSESNDTCESAHSEHINSMNGSGTKNKHTLWNNSDLRNSQVKRKDERKRTDHGKEKDCSSKSSNTTRNNRRCREKEHSDKDTRLKKKDKTSTSFNQDTKNDRVRGSNHARKHDQNKKSSYAKMHDHAANNDLLRKRNDQPSKTCATSKVNTQKNDEATQGNDPPPINDQPGTSRHCKIEKKSASRDKHKRKKKQKLKRRRSQSESKSETGYTKHRMTRSSSYTAPSNKEDGQLANHYLDS